MNIFKKYFSGSKQPLKKEEQFWEWFVQNENYLYWVVRRDRDIQNKFFSKISPKLDEIRAGFWCEVGMCNKNTVELIISADGLVKNFVFAEELVTIAPKLVGWKFTALKPAIDLKDINIEMSGYQFCRNNLHFIVNDFPEYPDEIDLSFVHDLCTIENKSKIGGGIYIFLENLLGELELATSIDEITILSPDEVKKDLISIDKLKSYLKWRQSEFVEKYIKTSQITLNDSYTVLEGNDNDDNRILAVINTEILNWDEKASHPWILKLEIPFNQVTTDGMPDDTTFNLLNDIENEITSDLKSVEGYLHIGRETKNFKRYIYFACADFRKPSKILHQLKIKHKDQFEIFFDIYKDKYWLTFKRFKPD
jgi:Family of unknown function (DUF695)